MSKSERIYTELKSMIVSGDLEPGAVIDKPALAERLGASRQPIAAAIDRLAFEGLVNVIPQHGSFVSGLDPERTADWLLIRMALESEFAIRFAQAGDAAPRADLERNLRYQEAAAAAGDGEGLYELDKEFHRILTGFTPSAEGNAMLERAQVHLGRIRRLLMPRPGRMHLTLAEHRAIFDAIAAGDAAGAAAAMRAHILSVEAHLAQLTADHPELLG